MTDMTDKEAALRLLREYERLLYSRIYDLLCHEKDTQDVMQDVAEKMIRHPDRWRDLSPPKQVAYMVQTARNTALNYLRHRKVEHAHIACSLDEDDRDIDALLIRVASVVDLDRLADMDLLRSALENLAPREQDLLKGKYWLGLTDRELSEIAGCQPASVRTLLSRARKRLKHELERSKDGDEII